MVNLMLGNYLCTRDAGRLEVAMKLSRILGHEMHTDES